MSLFANKMKNRKFYSVKTVPKSNRKIKQTDAKIDTCNTHLHERTLSCLGTDTSIANVPELN